MPKQATAFRLPLRVPVYAPLPSGSRMPFRPNPQFVGRTRELKALAAALSSSTTAAIGQIAAATGLGGIGKTQLAVEFVHRYGQYFPGGVFWLGSDTEELMRVEVVSCGLEGDLGLPSGFPDMPLAEQIQLVRQAWAQPIARLLVFDNCEDEVLLASWRPPLGGCRVLVTSRRADWDDGLGVQVLPLDVLLRQESITLLRTFRPDLAADDPELDAIAAELGDLPLALHLAGSYLKQNRHDMTLADYLAELRADTLLQHSSLAGEDLTYSATNHALHVGRTFALSYEQLDATRAVDGRALALLARAAYFAPGEPIPRDLLKATLDNMTTAHQFGQAMRRLRDLGLIEEEADGALRLHRLLATFLRGLSADATAQTSVEQALLATVIELNQAGIPAPLLAIQAHLRRLTNAAIPRGDARTSLLCNEFGNALKICGDYSGARPYYEQALAIRRGVLGEGHIHTAISLNNLASLLQDQGDLEGARPYYEQALAIREDVLGTYHPRTARSLGSLGYLLHGLGDLELARLYLERALAIRQEVLGKHHPDTAHSLNDLGMLLHDLGDLDGARFYVEQGLAIRQEVLGKHHPDTAHSLNDLSIVLKSQGNLDGARFYIEQALAIYQEVFGGRHPYTATSLGVMGQLLRAQHDLAGARSCLEQALEIRQDVLGKRHPDTARSLNSLGVLLQASGDLTGARPYLEHALAIFTQTLGPQHPHTLICQANLAALNGPLPPDP